MPEALTGRVSRLRTSGAWVFDTWPAVDARRRSSSQASTSARSQAEIGHNGHGVTDHTQGNWNGVAGRIELRATAQARIERVDLYPSFVDRTLTVRGRLRRTAGAAGPGRATVTFAGRETRANVTWDTASGAFEVTVHPGAADAEARRAWDEFDPVLHGVAVRLPNGEAWAGRFGWRELLPTPAGFTLNGRPVMFRGALECSIFPLTGHPATDVDSWRRIMRRAKDYGLNHLRFHSYCPPEAAFDAADEVGVYLQIETVWANQSVRIGDGLPVDQWVYAETDRILAAHGNHPSFLLMTHGNEPGGGKTKEGEAKRDAFLGAYVRHYRGRDTRRLWTSGAGWPIIDDNQFHVTPTPRVQGWGEGLDSRINGRPPETETDYRGFINAHRAPVISHEIGQWCVYPNLDERPKYTGYLKAKNFDIYADRLADNGLLELAPQFLHASGRLQVLCYKEDIESALRTPGMGGFQLLGLQDFPGQGTALVGVVDPFWDDKGYVTGEEYRRFCGPTTPLARLPTRIAQSGAAYAFAVDIAHFRRRADRERPDRVAYRGRRWRRAGGRRAGDPHDRAGQRAARAFGRPRLDGPARPRRQAGRQRHAGRAPGGAERLGYVGLSRGRARRRVTRAARRPHRPSPAGPFGARRRRADRPAGRARGQLRRASGPAWLLQHLLEHAVDGGPASDDPGRPL